MATEILATSNFNMDETSEISSPTLKTPLCKHKTKTSLFISRTKMNPGKKFLCCPYWKVDNYGYWKWVEEGSSYSKVGKFIVIEIEELKRRMELVEKIERENSGSIETTVRKMKKTKKELIEEMGDMRSEIVGMRIEMQRMQLGMKELGHKMKANAKWNLLATIIGFLLLAYMLPSQDHKAMLSLPL